MVRERRQMVRTYTLGWHVWPLCLACCCLWRKGIPLRARKIGFNVGPKGEPNDIESLMLESDDGLIWRKRAVFQEIAGDETAFLFDQQGGIRGIGRRRGMAQLLQSNPPDIKWMRHNLDRHIGGPLISKWGANSCRRAALDRQGAKDINVLVGRKRPARVC